MKRMVGVGFGIGLTAMLLREVYIAYLQAFLLQTTGHLPGRNPTDEDASVIEKHLDALSRQAGELAKEMCMEVYPYTIFGCCPKRAVCEDCPEQLASYREICESYLDTLWAANRLGMVFVYHRFDEPLRTAEDAVDDLVGRIKRGEATFEGLTEEVAVYA